MADLAQRFPQNPLLIPAQVAPSLPGLKVECLLNPGVFQYQGRIHLLIRVAERPELQPGRVRVPIMEDGRLKVLARSAEPLMEPLAEYEKQGFFGQVVFTNGHLVNGDELTLYYGASDSVICAAKLSVSAVLDSLR